MGEHATQRACIALSLLGVVAPVVYLAWMRGGVDLDSVPVFTGVLALLSFVCWIGPLLGLRIAAPWPAALLPLVPLLHLIPWPTGLLPPLRRELLTLFQQFGVEPWGGISIYPYATLRASVVLAGCCALFVLARGAVAGTPRVFWALGAPLALLGAAEAMIGVGQYLRAVSIDDATQWVASGTLVNRGHYAALLEGCLGVTLGWGFMLAGACCWRRLSLAAGAAATFAATGGCLLGIVLSFSRAGIAVAVLMLAAALCTFTPGRRRSLLIVASVVIATGVAASVVGLDGLAERFAGLAAGDTASRLVLWRDSWHTAGGHLWTGSGLGTFAFAFRRSEMYLPLKTIDHAHSDYLQALVELGLPAAAFLFVTLAWQAWRTSRRTARMKSVRRRTLAMGCWLGVGGILLHAAVDFPLQIPAIAALVAVLAGAAVGLTEERPRQSGATDASQAPAPPDRRSGSIPGQPRATTGNRSLTSLRENINSNAERPNMLWRRVKRARHAVPLRLRNHVFTQTLTVTAQNLLDGGARWFVGAVSLAFAVLGLVLFAGGAAETDAEGLFVRGSAAMAAGHWAEADHLFQQALTANPYAAVVWLKRAEIAETRGASGRAKGMARLAQRLEPYTLRVEWPPAQLYLRSQDFKQAANSLGRLAQAIPSMRASIYEAAWRAGMPPALLVRRVVPRTAEAAGEYLCYLARRGEWEQIVPAHRALASQHEGEPPAVMLQYVVARLSQAGRDFESQQLAAAIRQREIRR